MTFSWEQIRVDDGFMRLYFSAPAGGGPFPGVVVIQPQGGVDKFVQEMTERISAAGLRSQQKARICG